jgi:hypothetical protein
MSTTLWIKVGVRKAATLLWTMVGWTALKPNIRAGGTFVRWPNRRLAGAPSLYRERSAAQLERCERIDPRADVEDPWR